MSKPSIRAASIAFLSTAAVCLTLLLLMARFSNFLLPTLGCWNSPEEMRSMGNYCGHGQGVGLFFGLFLIVTGGTVFTITYLSIRSHQSRRS